MQKDYTRIHYKPAASHHPSSVTFVLVLIMLLGLLLGDELFEPLFSFLQLFFLLLERRRHSCPQTCLTRVISMLGTRAWLNFWTPSTL